MVSDTSTVPDGWSLRKRLAALPEEIKEAESAALAHQQLLAEAEDSVRLREARLVLGGEITGSNELARKAQLAEALAGPRYEIRLAEERLALARIAAQRLRDEFSAARVTLRYLAGIEEDV